MRKLKYLVLTTVILCQYTINKAQETVTDPNIEYKVLAKKFAGSEEDIKDEKKNIKPATWIKRGDLLQDIYNVDQKYLQLGASFDQILTLFYKDPISSAEGEFAGEPVLIQKYERREVYVVNNAITGWKVTEMVTDDPLIKAYDAYNKAMEIDPSGKTTSKLEKNILDLKFNCEREASLAFTSKDYKRSYEYFKYVLLLAESPAIEDKITDSASYYNAGLAALNAEMYEEAVKNFIKAKDVKYGGSNVYFMIKRAYETMGDSVNVLKTLQDGFKAYPGDKVIVIELINYYLNKGQAEQALEYIGIAKEDDPSNASLLFAEGTLYDKMKERDKAIEVYKEAIEIKPDYFDAYYNLGVVYFNAAVELYNEASTIPPKEAKRYDETIEKGNVELEKSIPYMEKALEISEKNYQKNPAEIEIYQSTLETVKTIYFRLRNRDAMYQTKLDEVNSKLEGLQ